YTYDGDNHVLTQEAFLTANKFELTQYVYGVSPATGSAIYSNDILASTIYPANGQPNTESYTVNALGQRTTMTDRNGTTHAYTYDVLGQQTSDTVTTLGAGVDRSILRIDTAYDTA